MEWVNEIKNLLDLKRDITRIETQYILAWQQLNMPKEVIALANEYTCLMTGKLSFAYMDKVLSRWEEKGVRTLAEAKALIAASRRSFSSKRKQSMKLILEDGTQHELTDWERVVLDMALVSFNGTKEKRDYYDEETRQAVYAAYESLRALVPDMGC